MTKAKSTKRALLSSVLVILMCVTMLIGTTFAWFTDSVTSGGNVIKTGKLDILFEKWNGTAWEDASTGQIFNYENWEPGYTQVVNLRVVNNGSLALKWLATITTEDNLSILADVINVYVRSDDQNDTVKDYINSLGGRADWNTLAEQGQFKKFTLHQFVNNLSTMTTGTMVPNQESYLGIVLQMDPAAGNDYQGLDLGGKFDLKILATQLTKENDSFNDQYDAGATYPIVALGIIPIDQDEVAANPNARQDFDVKNFNDAKAGSISIPNSAIDPDADEIRVTYIETVVDQTVTVEADQSAKTYDISVEGIKENNTSNITVVLKVGPGLTGVKLYHKNVEVPGASYDPSSGNITFNTKSFSPYTVVFDVVEEEKDLNKEVPTAIVTKYEETPEFTWDGTFITPDEPYKSTETLDAVYNFNAPHDYVTVQECAYADWQCDYYVRLETDKYTTLPANSILLGGNYGEFKWNGFTNPEVPTNSDIPLLGSVVEVAWTYEGIVSLVQNFDCGVGVVEATGTDLSGAKFVVMLRLTNPENLNEYYNVNTVVYDFDTKTSTITNYPN